MIPDKSRYKLLRPRIANIFDVITIFAIGTGVFGSSLPLSVILI